jgi:molybdate transport system substrate-binding protein
MGIGVFPRVDGLGHGLSLLTVVLGVLAAATGCGGAGSRADSITVSAASDLVFAFREIGAEFERETGVRVVFNFGSTGQLARQIEFGAPADVFAAANASYVDSLVSSGRLEGDSRRVDARGVLAIWVSAGSRLQAGRTEDLAAPEVRRIAIANPEHAPYGAAAREALMSAGVWDTVQPRL